MLCSFQACNSEEDGLFGFDVNSDGSGQRYVLLIFMKMVSCCSLSGSYAVKQFVPLDVGIWMLLSDKIMRQIMHWVQMAQCCHSLPNVPRFRAFKWTAKKSFGLLYDVCHCQLSLPSKRLASLHLALIGYFSTRYSFDWYLIYTTWNLC